MMGTFVPIYLGYFWLWLRHFKFGWKVSGEKWSRTHVKNAARFYRLAVRMKGGLIKVGQIISTRVDIMPPEWIQGLEGLQDRVDPLPWKRIAKHLTQQFGAPPDELFAERQSVKIAIGVAVGLAQCISEREPNRTAVRASAVLSRRDI